MYLEIKNLTKQMKNNMVLDSINLELEKGMIYGIQGKNGCGKTMLMKTICGLIRPTEGEVWINNEKLGDKYDFPQSVGALIENPGFLRNYSAFANLKILSEIKGIVKDDDINNILEEVGLGDVGKKKYRKFSLGMKQKLGIAAALLEKPDLIILDEPTNALDEESVHNLRDMLFKRKQQGALILIASHDKEELELLSDQIIKMENGRIKK